MSNFNRESVVSVHRWADTDKGLPIQMGRSVGGDDAGRSGRGRGSRYHHDGEKTTCAEKRKLTPDLGGRTTPEAAGPLWPMFLLTKGLHRGDLITYGLDDTA